MKLQVIKDTLVSSKDILIKNCKKHGPTGLVILGAGLAVIAVASAIIDTKELDKNINDEMKEVYHVKEERKSKTEDEYSNKDYACDLIKAWVKLGAKVVKTYSKTFIFLGGSLVCTLSGTKIIHTRYINSVAVGAAIQKEFFDYRSYVEKKYGKSEDIAAKYGDEPITIEVATTDGENPVLKKTEIVPINLDDMAGTSIFFDVENLPYHIRKNPTLAYSWLKGIQDDANRILRSRWRFVRTPDGIKTLQKGWIYWFEVVDLLRIAGHHISDEMRKKYATYGWTYDGNEEIDPAQKVSFGIFDFTTGDIERKFAFRDGDETCALLEFNCYPIT